MGDLVPALQYLERTWYTKRGLFAALLLAAAGVCTITFPLAPWWVALIATCVIDLTIAIAWWSSITPEKTPQNKIGFLVCISTSDDSEALKLHEDFVRPLKQLIKSGNTGHIFHFMESPQRLAREVEDLDQAQALRIRSRAHFMIWGRVRRRQIDGKDHHVIDLEGAVSHRPVADNISKALATEFSELLPRKLHISIDNDFLTFQFTSEWADLVARYVIGLAAAISGDFNYAETLFKDAYERLQTRNHSLPAYQKLKQRIPARISELYAGRAQRAYRKWLETRDPDLLNSIEEYLQHLTQEHQQSPAGLTLKAIIAFLSQHDADAALTYIKKIREQNTAVWHLNAAFLLAYKGRLKDAIRHYRQVAHLEADIDGVSQVEDFMVWVLQQNPEKYQLHYCLGFLNWQIKGDLIQATEDFSNFLQKCPQNTYTKECQLASQWIGEIRNQADI